MWVVKTDMNGMIEWDKTIFTEGHDEIGFAIETSDGGYAMANYTNSWSAGYCTEPNRDSSNITYDYYLIKFKDALSPEANFTATARDICPKTCIDFSNLSLNSTSYQWIFPGTSAGIVSDTNPATICYNNPGTYDVTLIAYYGTHSDTLTLSNYINVFPVPPTLNIVQVNDSLYAQTGFSTYQWYVNGIAIAGANDNYHIALFNGTYELFVTDSNGCSTNSGVINVMTGMDFPFAQPDGFAVYPNPATNEFTVQFNAANQSMARIELLNAVGQCIIEKEIKSDVGTNSVTLSGLQLPAGLYVLRIYNGTLNMIERIVIEKRQ